MVVRVGDESMTACKLAFVVQVRLNVGRGVVGVDWSGLFAVVALCHGTFFQTAIGRRARLTQADWPSSLVSCLYIYFLFFALSPIFLEVAPFLEKRVGT